MDKAWKWRVSGKLGIVRIDAYEYLYLRYASIGEEGGERWSLPEISSITNHQRDLGGRPD